MVGHECSEFKEGFPTLKRCLLPGGGIRTLGRQKQDRLFSLRPAWSTELFQDS